MYLDKFDGGGGCKVRQGIQTTKHAKGDKKTIPVKISNVKNPSSKLAETL